MVLEIVCGSCGTILYSGYDLRAARDIIRLYRGRCKKCGIPLSSSEFSLTVDRHSSLAE